MSVLSDEELKELGAAMSATRKWVNPDDDVRAVIAERKAELEKIEALGFRGVVEIKSEDVTVRAEDGTGLAWKDPDGNPYLRVGQQRREATVAQADGGKISFTLSSETPAERWYGTEILSHDKNAIRMDRVNRGAMPLLFNHNWDDPIGMIDSMRVKDGKTVVDAHFFDTSRANDIKQMVAGGLRNVSVGYQVHTFEEDTKSNTYTATDWEPLEGSIVTVPMDATVGVGREAEKNAIAVRVLTTQSLKAEPAGVTAPEVSQPAKAAPTEATMADQNAGAGASAQVSVKENTPVPGMTGEEYEKKRGKAIRKMAEGMGVTDSARVSYWIASGKDYEEIAEEAVAMQVARSKEAALAIGNIGLTTTETKKFSVARAIRAIASRDYNSASMEFEISREVAKKIGKQQTDSNICLLYTSDAADE